jgi:hypothetical protein
VVIAAVEGSAFAGGLGFVCAADIAFAGPTARFCAPEVRRGLVPAQILPWLTRRMGRSAAAKLCLQGNTIDAAEAARIGLVHQAVPDLEAAVATAIADILEGAPNALAETKARSPPSVRPCRRAMPRPAPRLRPPGRRARGGGGHRQLQGPPQVQLGAGLSKERTARHDRLHRRLGPHPLRQARRPGH